MRRRELVALLGFAVAWSVRALAQQPMPVIGYLSSGSPESDNIPARLIAFRQGLNEAGYIEGQNVAIEYRWAEGQNNRLAALAADLVHREVSAIVTPGTAAALAVKAATSAIPIVFVVGVNPIPAGLVDSLNRPGGNVTGVALLSVELEGKRLELLHELLPTADVVAILVNPTNPDFAEPETANLQDAARSLGLQVHVLRASTSSEIDTAFGTLAELPASALVVGGDPFFTSQRSQIIELAAQRSVPAIYVWREFSLAGGLMSYGPNNANSNRLAGIYVSKILRGATPADLPVQQVTKLDLVINLKTAKALGLRIPPLVLARADEVIE